MVLVFSYPLAIALQNIYVTHVNLFILWSTAAWQAERIREAIWSNSWDTGLVLRNMDFMAIFVTNLLHDFEYITSVLCSPSCVHLV